MERDTHLSKPRWVYVLFNEEAKRPVVLSFAGVGAPVLLVWSSRERAEVFLRSLPVDKRQVWRAYEWTCEDLAAWLHRDRSLAGVEMDPQMWPCAHGVLIHRQVYESIRVRENECS